MNDRNYELVPCYTAPDNRPADQLFRADRMAISENALVLREEVLASLEEYEAQYSLRTRKRRPEDHERLVKQLDALLASVVLMGLKTPERWLSVSLNKAVLGKRGRYAPEFMTAKFSELLQALAHSKLAWIEFNLGYKNDFNPNLHKQSTFKAASRLMARIEALELSPEDYGHLKGAETIVLRSLKDGFWDSGEDIDYQDTDQTNAMRGQMAELNGWLMQARLTCYQDHLDSSNVSMRRIFNGDFEHGGRLYGGFWQGMKNETRRTDILIEQRRVAVLDFGQMGARIAYSKVGVEPPSDAYSIAGLEQCRAGVKKLMSAMLNVNSPMKRLPANCKDLLPKGATIKTITDQIMAAHLPIVDLFHNGTGLELMRIESEILLKILFRLKDAGVVALPIHDAIVVREDKKDLAKEVMLSEFKLQTGFEGIVTEE